MLVHFTSVVPVQFLFQPSRMTQLQTFLMTQLNCLSIDHIFHSLLCYHYVSCTIITPTGLLPVGNVQARLGRRIFCMHVKSCDVSSNRLFSRARVGSAAAAHIETWERRQHSRVLSSRPLWLQRQDVMSPSQSILRKESGNTKSSGTRLNC